MVLAANGRLHPSKSSGRTVPHGGAIGYIAGESVCYPPSKILRWTSRRSDRGTVVA